MTGLMEGAHPTAPGGMSKKALREELVTKHHYTPAEVAEGMMTWPELIEAVVQGRLAREEEAREKAANPPLLVLADDTLDYTFDGHAGAGPSGAERWMNCTKSLGMSRAFLETLTPNQQKAFARANTAARQGTTAHTAAAAELDYRLDRISVAERDAILLELAIMPDDGEEYTDEMAEAVSLYTDLAQQFIAERGEENVLVEARLSAAVWLTGAHDGEWHVITGSGDCVVMPTKKNRSLVVIDYKHGDGINVDVDSNPQVRIYGLGALDALTDEDGNLTMDVDEIIYYIVQPRLGGIKEWRESLDDLLDWRDETLAPALTAALYDDDPAAEFHPSEETCQWCPAKGGCGALAKQRMEAATDLFSVIVEAEYADGPGAFPETDTLDNDRLGHLLEQIDGLVKIREVMREEAQRRLHRGEAVPGYKLVGYQPRRVWKPEAAEELREDWPDLYVEEMVTPTQALKLAKAEGAKEEVLAELEKEYIVKPDPVPIIAPAGDRRKEWNGKPPEALFPDEMGEQ